MKCIWIIPKPSPASVEELSSTNWSLVPKMLGTTALEHHGFMRAKLLLGCPTVCHPLDCSLPGSSTHGSLQAPILEWVDVRQKPTQHCKVIFLQLKIAMPSFRSSPPKNQTHVSCGSCIAGGFFTSWATREAPEYWNGSSIPSAAHLPDPGIKPGSPELQAASL